MLNTTLPGRRIPMLMLGTSGSMKKMSNIKTLTFRLDMMRTWCWRRWRRPSNCMKKIKTYLDTDNMEVSEDEEPVVSI